MDSEELEKLLESVFDVEKDDIVLSDNTPLPCKLLWIVSDGSYVTKGQIIAILTPSSNNEDKELNNKENVYNKSDYKQLEDLQHFENIGDVGQSNLILKSNRDGKIVKFVENLTELNNIDEVLGRIESTFCSHEVVVHGLCAKCSSQVETSIKRKHDDLSLLTDLKMSPGFITNYSGFEIDADLAYDMECSEILRHLDDRKLCLVLDLDNTLLHATSQKPPVDIDIEMVEVSSEQCKKDLNYIHNSTDDDSESMKLQQKLESCILKTIVFNESETTFCNSYFKLRPGVFNFFRKVSKNYKLFLFTMGTRQHAHSALEILDPKGLYLGNRVFCRNDSKICMKSLDRIFPKHKNLVLVLDDSEYVWTNNLGLIKVHPYYFFPDLTYLNNFDLNNLTKSSAALQSICNYSNFIWSKLIHTSNNNTGSSNDEKQLKNNDKKVDQDGFAIPSALKKPQFRYNGYLICNERPSDMYSTNTSQISGSKGKVELFKKIKIKDNDRQLDKLIKLLDDIYTRFYEEYDSLISNSSKHTSPTNKVNSPNKNGHLDNSIPVTENNVKVDLNNSNDNDNNKDNEQNNNPDNEDNNNNSDSESTTTTNNNEDKQLNNKENNDSGINDTTTNNNDSDSENSSNTSSNSNKDSDDKESVSEIDIKYLIDNNLLPKASMVLKQIRENILKNLILYSNTCEFINLPISTNNEDDGDSESNEDINFLLCSDFGKWALKFGAKIANRLSNVTHVIVNNRNSMVINDNSIKKVHIKWLEAVIYCYEHVDEKKFNPDNWKTPFRTFWDVLYS